MTAGFGVLLSTLTVIALMRYLTKKSYKDNLNVSTSKLIKRECFVLRYSKSYEIFGFVSFIVAGIFGILACTDIAPIKTIGDIIAFAFVDGLFIVLGAMIMAMTLNVKIEVSNSKIKYWNIFKISKEISWEDIKKVECSKNHRELKLVADKKSITVHTWMIGFRAFEMRMMTKLDKDIYEEALKKVFPFPF